MTVYLKEREGKKGTTLYLRWWEPNKTHVITRGPRKGEATKGEWAYDFLKSKLTGDKTHDDEILREAKTLRITKERDLEASADGFIPSFKKKITFIGFFESVSKKDSNWNNVLKHLKEFPGAHVALGRINSDWVRAFQEFLLSRVTANTAYTQMSVLKSALNRAVKDRVISLSPARAVDSIKKTDVEVEYLTEDELRALANTPCGNRAAEEVKRAFMFSCFTGLRISDVRRLKWENIEDGKLKFRQKKTKGFEYLPLSHSAREPPLPGQPKDIIPMPGNFIFKLVSQPRVNILLKRWARRAGVKKQLYYHMSRHTAATLLLEKGVDLYTVSKILGHKSINTTQRYAKVTGKLIQEAVNKLPEIKLGTGRQEK